MSIRLHLGHGIQQNIDTLLFTQAIHMQKQWAICGQTKALEQLWISFSRRKFLQVNTVGNRPSRSMQAMLVEQTERSCRRGSHIFPAVAEIDQVRVAHIAKMLANKGL